MRVGSDGELVVGLVILVQKIYNHTIFEKKIKSPIELAKTLAA